jgi:putative membrane-bound dehydrogenase-like protein
MTRFGRQSTTIGISVLMAVALPTATLPAAEPAKLSVLLLGDAGHHRPAEMAKILTPVLAGVGIRVDYTADVEALAPVNLAKYDVLAIFRDSGELPASEEAALFDFIEQGKGLVAIHCASHCFRNSDKYTALVGGRFLRHGTGVFRARIIDAQHPALHGVKSFETWDETYIHDQLADDIRVLMVRPENGGCEPYTWVRRQGRGRVFYTALGHDERTWKQPGFHKLLEQAIRWAAAPTPPLSPPSEGGDRGGVTDIKPFEYTEANIPNYLPGKRWGTTGEPIRRMQLPLAPAESMKHMHLPEGFEVQLFAAEPDIARPIAMAWDARGRLWIAETVDYPNDMQPPGQGNDRIKICEDTDGDGKADKFTVFADKLSIPTSLVFANGGVIVAQMPDTLFLKATGNDDRADVRRVLFSGWGTSDTHAGPSNLRWGFDNWIWGTVGYSGFDGSVNGQGHRFGQGIFRFKLGQGPEVSELEFLTSTTNNTWGLGFSETGQVFASSANNQHSVHLAIPNRMFESVRGWYGKGSAGIEDHKKFHPISEHVRQVDYHGGYTAACGHALYTARSFPSEYRDRAAFVCEPTGHLVHVDWLAGKGSGFSARDGWNILASDDEWTAPIMAEVGPDGALWVIDWYNYIVQHNPTPSGFQTGKGGAYITPARDKTRGRIYRIVYKGAKPTAKPHLGQASVEELVATLDHENLWWRQTAQRLLLERGKTDVLPALAAQVQDPQKGKGALHALWTMQGLVAFAAAESKWRPVLQAGLAHREPGVRRAALAVFPRTAESVADILAAGSLTDDDPQVRLAALLALAEMPSSRNAAATIVAILQEPRNAGDRWIPLAATSAAARSDLDFLLCASESRPKPEVERTFAEVVRVVAGHFARRAPVDSGGDVFVMLNQAQPSVAEALLTGLAAGWPAGKPAVFNSKMEAVLGSLPSKLSADGLLHLAALVSRWGQAKRLQGVTTDLQRILQKRVADCKVSDGARIAAAQNLVALGSERASLNALLDQITPKASPVLADGLLEALGQSDGPDVGSALIQRWSELTPSARSRALAVLLRRPAWTESLLAALEKEQIDKGDLAFDQVQQLGNHPDPALAARGKKVLAGSGRLPNTDRQKVVETLLPLATRHGEPGLGKVVFEKNCAKCHRFGALGQTVGPDLTGIGVRSRADVLTDILDPNRSVEGNYRQYTVATRKGIFLTGLVTAETKTAVELLDSEAKRHVVLREDIDSLIGSKLSLMPEGFEKLSEVELVSLLDFLTARERFFPLPLGKAATISSARGMFYDRKNEVERLIFRTWGPQTAFGVTFQVIDPRDGAIPNAILLYGPQGAVSREMPRSASVSCNAPAKAIHLLSGVSGWGYPLGRKGSVSMVVRLHYTDGQAEDHPLLNGVHFADYIRETDVPGSRLAFRLRGRQLRYLSLAPKRPAKIDRIEFVKGDDATAPLVMAVTVEAAE